MPYIDNVEQFEYTMYDKTAMQDFGNILEMNGWTKIKHFYKVVIGRKQYHYTKQEIESGDGVGQRSYRPYMYVTAKHMLYKNAKGRVLGMAEILTDSFRMLPPEMITANSTSTVLSSSTIDSFKDNVKNVFDNNKVKGLIYFYTVEKEPTVQDGFVTITYPIESLTSEMYYSTALDVELNGMTMYPTGNVGSGVDVQKRDLFRNANDDAVRPFAEPWVMQSTLVPVELFNSVNEQDSLDNVYSALNKWDDSEITVKGRIDSNSITVMLQSDSSANWENNRYPVVPLHFGEVDMENGEPNVYALFGGVTPPTPNFDFNSLTKYTGNAKTKLTIPVLKAYPSYPGDGVNNVVLSKTRGGSRYQAVYLSWGASPDLMPPNREGKNNKHYPISLDFDVRNFGFNPSRYSDSVHTSFIYVVHPEDGIIGKIRNVVGLQTFATNNPELRIKREDCPLKVTDAYQVFTVGAICPFTKTPSTTYSVAGIAIRGNTVERANYSTVPMPTNVSVTLRDNILHVRWDIENDEFHSGVRIDVDGIEVVPIVSGTNQYLIDLIAHGVVKPIESVGITSVNDKGKESDTVEVTL